MPFEGKFFVIFTNSGILEDLRGWFGSFETYIVVRRSAPGMVTSFLKKYKLLIWSFEFFFFSYFFSQFEF